MKWKWSPILGEPCYDNELQNPNGLEIFAYKYESAYKMYVHKYFLYLVHLLIQGHSDVLKYVLF